MGSHRHRITIGSKFYVTVHQPYLVVIPYSFDQLVNSQGNPYLVGRWVYNMDMKTRT